MAKMAYLALSIVSNAIWQRSWFDGLDVTGLDVVMPTSPCSWFNSAWVFCRLFAIAPAKLSNKIFKINFFFLLTSYMWTWLCVTEITLPASYKQRAIHPKWTV